MWEFLKQLLHAKPSSLAELRESPSPAPASGLLDNFKAEEAGDAEPDVLPKAKAKHEKKESKKQEKREHKDKKDEDDERSDAAFETLTGKKK